MKARWFCEHGFTPAQRKAIEEEVAHLRAALQPFADAYTEERWLDLSTPYDTRYDDTDVAELRYDDTGVTLGMLRRARAALEEP